MDGYRQQRQKFERSLVTPKADAAAGGVGEDEFEAFDAGGGCVDEADALAAHASADERRSLLQTHRKSLLAMGLVAGLLGAAPSLLWSVGLMAIAMAPLLVPLSIWVYTLIFVFSSLWFVHFCLEALQALRDEASASNARFELVTEAESASAVQAPNPPSLPMGNL